MAFNFPPGEQRPLTDDELEASLSAQIESSSGFYGDRIGTLRSELLSVYLRNGYVEDDERSELGLSTVVDSSAQDSVDHILSELLRIFTNTEDAVSFTPNGENDVEQSQQEMETVRHIFFNQNDGYLTLHHWLWDGLVMINGFVKAWHEKRMTVETETYSGLSKIELEALEMDFLTDQIDVTVLEHDTDVIQQELTVDAVRESHDLQMEILEADNAIVTPDGLIIIESERHTVKIQTRQEKKRIRVMPVPTDEILISSRWDSVNLQESPFTGHRFLETQGDLIALGADPEQVMGLPTSEDEEFGDERTTRFDGFDLFEADDRASIDDSSRTITVTECWFYADRDGDGIAELLYAKLAGADGQLLRWADSGEVMVEPVSEVPIHSWTPYIIPHRHFGESTVQRLQDIQRSQTVTVRQMQDNMALVNNAGFLVDTNFTDDDTMEDLLTFRPGRVIRGTGQNAVTQIAVDPMFDKSLTVLSYWDERREERSGATRINQGLTSDSLSKNVAGVTIAQLQEAGMNKLEMVARNFAETGFRSVFQHIHALLRRHQDRELAFQVRGNWVKTEPRAWGMRTDMTVNVGLGAASRLTKIEGLNDILSKQIEAIQQGAPVTDIQKVYNTLTDLTAAQGFKNVTRYWTDPSTIPPEPPAEEQDDPAMAIAEAEVEVGRMSAVAKLEAVKQKEAKDLRDAQLKTRELQLKLRELLLKDDRERDLGVLDASVKAEQNDIAALKSIVAPPPGQGVSSTVQ